MKTFIKSAAILVLVSTSYLARGQNSSVAIGTPSPNDKAVLLLVSGGNNQGIIIPIVSGVGAVSAGASEKGMVVFDDSDDKVKYFDGSTWTTVGAGGGSGSTELLSINGNAIQIGTTGTGSITIANTPPTVTGQLLMWDNGASRWTSTSVTPTPANGNVLTWNGSAWAPAPSAGGGNMSTSTYDVAANGIVDNSERIAGLTWPANAVGSLQNNGTGTLSWSPAAAALTNPMTTPGDMIVGAAGGTPARLGSATGILRSSGATPSWGTVDLSSTFNVSNLLGISNGGTGTASTLQNNIFAGPTSGTGAPSFRAMVAGDVPNLDAAKIATGTIPIARGGTGLSLTTPANGSLLIGNGAGFTNAVLSAGAGINISNGAGTITIASTGLSNPLTTTGDIIYGVGATPTRLGGSAGFLKSTGAAAPAWAAVNLASADVTGMLPIVNGGTGSTAIASATVPRSNGTSLVSSNIFSDGTNVSIGVNTFLNALTISKDASPTILGLQAYSTTATDQSRINLVRGRGTAAAPAAISSGDFIGNISFAGYSGASAFTGANISSAAVGNWGAGSRGTYISFFTTQNTTTTITERMRIGDDGNIGIGNTGPTERLDVTGNVKFSAALMPNNLPGAAGEVLTSQGANTAPIWLPAGGGLTLPFNSTTANGSDLFSITNTGTGGAGVFVVNNIANSNHALEASSSGAGSAVSGSSSGAGAGATAGLFTQSNVAALGNAVTISTAGLGNALSVSSTNAINAQAALNINHSGTGNAISANRPIQANQLIATGDVSIHGLNYTWPTSNATGVLTNNGLGGLTWTPSAAGFTTADAIPRGTGSGLGVYSIFDNGTTYTAIGRSTPIGSSRFDISTNAGSGSYGGMYMDTQAGGKPFYGFAQAGSGNAWIEWDGGDANKMKFFNGGPRMTIQPDGFTGIGTTTPSTLFEVSAVSPTVTIRTTGAGVSETATLQFINGAGTTLGSIGDPGSSTSLQLSSGANNMVFNTNFTPRLNILPTGNFLISAPSSGTAVDITGFGNWDVASTEGDLKIGSATHRLKMGVALSGGGAGDSYIATEGGTNRLFLGTAESSVNTQTLTVTGGKVGVGIISPGAGLEVNVASALAQPNGFRVTNDFSGGALNKIGIQSILTATGTFTKYGFFNTVNGTAGNASSIVGTYNDIIPNGSGSAWGTYNIIGNVGTGTRYGTYNSLGAASGSGSTVYGNYTSASHAGTGALYGSYTFLNHTSSGTVYGAFIDANKPTAGQPGTLYGLNVTADNDGSGDSYLLYANSVGATTGKEWGLYVTGEDESFFSNTVTFTTPNTSPLYAIRITRQSNPGDFWYEGSRLSDGDRFHGYNGTFRGNWSATDGTYSPSSDRRLKKHIEDLFPVTNMLLRLRPVNYHMNEQKDTDLKRIGFIAQEVKEVFPEFVSHDDVSDIYSLNYSSMSVIAIKAIQEQQEMINRQKAEIESLKSDVSSQRKTLEGYESSGSRVAELEKENREMKAEIAEIREALGLRAKGPSKEKTQLNQNP